MSNREVFKKPEVIIVKGRVKRAIVPGILFGKNTVKGSTYIFSVSEVIKPKNAKLPQEIRIIDKYYGSTAMISLEKDMNAVVYLTKVEGNYVSHREINLDTATGMSQLKGLNVFLKLMSIQQVDEQTISCIDAFKKAKSVPEKNAVLDAMWETRNAEYIPLLLNIAKGYKNARIRAWAITILAYLENSNAVKELIPLLKDPSSEVKRQVLVAFRIHKTKEAILPIESLLTEDISDYLRQVAQETLEKIKANNR